MLNATNETEMVDFAYLLKDIMIIAAAKSDV